MADEHPPSNEHKEEKKSYLEEVIDDISGMVKKTAAVATVTALPFAYSPFNPDHIARAATTTYAYAASKATTNIMQKKDPLDGIVRNSLNGTLISYPLSKGFQALNSLESFVEPSYGTVAAKIAKGAGMALVHQPLIVTGNTALNYGLGKKFREKAWPNIKKAAKWIAIPGIINVNWLYSFGLLTQMAVSGALSFMLNASNIEGEGSIKNLYKAMNPVPYISGATGTAGKLARTAYYGTGQVAYSLGEGLANLTYSSKPSTTAPANHQ